MLDINIDIKRMERAREERARSIVKIHLETYVGRVEDMAGRLLEVVEGSKSVKAAYKPLRDMVSLEIERASEGNITAVEYTQKNLSKQEVLVFVGTHWVKVKMQVWYDFVKDCARRAGLPMEFLEDPEFMTRLFEQSAFRITRDRELMVPRNFVWINMQNGTLEIGSGGSLTFREHRREDFFQYVLPYCYDPLARCPGWHAFLDRVLPEKAVQDLVAEFIAWGFTGNDYKLEKVLILYGGGSNGKSVLTDLITATYGESNCSHVELEGLTNDIVQRALTEHKLVNISQENGPNVNYSVLKSMVSGEPVLVKSLYKDPKLMYTYGKLIASYNTLPRMENTEGFFRRWLLVPFNVTIGREERDIHLKEKLLKELPGILNWVLRGLARLIANRDFTESPMCEAALEDCKRSSNSALRFVSECCVEAEDGRLSLKELFAGYNRFCHEDNVQDRYRFGKKRFAEQLESAGYTSDFYGHYKCYKLKFKSEL